MRRWCLLGLLLVTPASAQSPTQPPPAASPPAAPPDRAAQTATERRAALDQALAALRAAGTEQEAAALEAKLRQLWLNAGTPAVTLLLGRGLREMQAGAHEEATRDFEAALVLDPQHAEAWHQIARARHALGDTPGAIAAISETLRREPGHFAALQTLSRIAEAREDWKGAYAAWQKVLELAPKLEGGETKLKDLKRRALGDET